MKPIKDRDAAKRKRVQEKVEKKQFAELLERQNALLQRVDTAISLEQPELLIKRA